MLQQMYRMHIPIHRISMIQPICKNKIDTNYMLKQIFPFHHKIASTGHVFYASTQSLRCQSCKMHDS